MDMLWLTCKNHPNLRWLCKEIAYTEGLGYNGSRNLFFEGDADGNYCRECDCKAADLIKVQA